MASDPTSVPPSSLRWNYMVLHVLKLTKEHIQCFLKYENVCIYIYFYLIFLFFMDNSTGPGAPVTTDQEI